MYVYCTCFILYIFDFVYTPPYIYCLILWLIKNIDEKFKEIALYVYLNPILNPN